MPPKRGSVWPRERFCEPPPHDFVHVDHWLKLLVWQLRGQLCVLHGRVSAPCGQSLPPFSGCLSGRVRRWEPPPHDLVHDV